MKKLVREENGAPALVRQLSKRYTPLEHLINVMRLVMPHVFDLEMHIEMREFGVTATEPFAILISRGINRFLKFS